MYCLWLALYDFKKEMSTLFTNLLDCQDIKIILIKISLSQFDFSQRKKFTNIFFSPLSNEAISSNLQLQQISSHQTDYMEIQNLKLIANKYNRHYNKKLKVCAFMILFAAFTLYRFSFVRPTTTCINDEYHNFTFNINRQLVQQDGPAFEGNNNQLTLFGKIFIGIGQILMDFWIIIIASVWLFRTNNLRVMLTLGLFYMIRGIIFLNAQKLPFPDYFAWRSPGFLSITVPYDHTRDFFFSGHCGGLTIISAQIFYLGFSKAGILSVLSIAYMANMLLTTRDHYSIDIVAGIIFALWFYKLARRCTQIFDRIMSMPYVLWLRLVKWRKNKKIGPIQSQDIMMSSSIQKDNNTKK